MRHWSSSIKKGKRSDLGDIHWQSSWEANIARFLNLMKSYKEVISWEYEPETFWFPVKQGTRSYTPDFKVVKKNGTIEYWEVKGFFTDRSKTALKRMKKYHPTITIFLIDSHIYKQISQYQRLIENWE